MSEIVKYPIEILDADDDDGSIVANVDHLRDLIVGAKIVSAERGQIDASGWNSGRTVEGFIITLNTGARVTLENTNDCCAFTELESFLLNAEKIDHVITGIGTTDGYNTWHIYADFGDVLELKVGWSCGNPFYYGYGFDITFIHDHIYAPHTVDASWRCYCGDSKTDQEFRNMGTMTEASLRRLTDGN